MFQRSHLLSALAVTSALYGGNGYDGRFDLFAGWRDDEFNWSIQGPFGEPNVFAEIDWRHTETFLVGARGYLAGWDKIYARLGGDYGKIIQSGPVVSLYALNDRQGLFVRDRGFKTGNSVFDLKGALGFHVLPNCGPFDIAFCAGFAWQGQNFRLRNPTVEESLISLIPFNASDLKVRYHSRWKSGFLGVNAYWNFCRQWSLSAEGELHYASFRGKGWWDYNEPDWERRRHHHMLEYFHLKWDDSATGWGENISGTLSYHSGRGWYFGVIGGYQHFQTRPGDHCVSFHKENIDPLELGVTFPSEDAVLNPIVWNTYFVCFNFEVHF